MSIELEEQVGEIVRTGLMSSTKILGTKTQWMNWTL